MQTRLQASIWLRVVASCSGCQRQLNSEDNPKDMEGRPRVAEGAWRNSSVDCLAQRACADDMDSFGPS